MAEFLRVSRGDAVTNLSPEARRPNVSDTVQVVNTGQVRTLIENLNLPLDPTTIGKVVGYGFESVGFRIHGNDKPYVGVLSPVRGDIKQNIRQTGENVCFFGEYGVPSQTVIVNGWKNQPMALKVSQEVRGGTLYDMGLIELIGNPQLLQDFVTIADLTIANLKKSGTLVDLNGYSSDKRLKYCLYKLLPTLSQNIVIDEESNRLKLVDLESHHRKIKGASLKRKILLNVESASIMGWKYICKGMLKVNAFTDTFRQKQKDGLEIDDKEQATFDKGISFALTEMNNSGLKYSVVGSVAHAATMADFDIPYTLTPRRSDGSRRDLDIILLSDLDEKARQLQEKFLQMFNSIKGFPEVNINPTCPLNSEEGKRVMLKGKYLKVMHTGQGHDDDNNIYLTYGDHSTKIPEELLAPITRSYNGTEFTTFAPGVLAGFWETRGGAIKFKDKQKVIQLLKQTKSQIPQVFLDFSHDIRSTYPKSYQQFMLRELLLYLSNGNIRPDIIKEKAKSLIKNS